MSDYYEQLSPGAEQRMNAYADQITKEQYVSGTCLPFTMIGILSSLLGITPKQTLEDKSLDWRKTLRCEIRRIDRDIHKMGVDEKKAMKECKNLSAKGHSNATRHLVKQVVNTRKAVTRMHVSKAQLNSVIENLRMSKGMLKMQDILGQSAFIMKEMNSLARLPDMQKTMSGMAREMMKAGLIEKQIEDTMDMLEPDDLEDEIDAEVNKIMAELTSQTLTGDTAALTSKPIVVHKVAAADEEEVPLMNDADINILKIKLTNL